MRRAVAAFLLLLAARPSLAQDAPSPEQVELFEKKIRPLLVERCYECHGPAVAKPKGGLRLDTREGWRRGGNTFGTSVVPGDPDRSPLIQAVRWKDEVLSMPPKKALPPEEVALLERWVKLGAHDPRTVASATIVAAAPADLWALRPVTDPPPPEVLDVKWPATPLDRFALAKLEQKGLAPSPEADRPTLIRRASFDLIGLPPTPDEIADFVWDDAPGAFERVVDRLLASPHHGERWGRHWLDVARYADTKGYVFEEERRYVGAWTYRDWVVRALNEDLPYDRFVVEQLAADRLPRAGDGGSLAALGFLTLGRRFLNNANDVIDDRIDVVTRGFLGLTVACARCHDHKYDPIPTADYYSLAGVFASTREPAPPAIGPSPKTPEGETYARELAARERALEAFRQERLARELGRARSEVGLQAYLGAALEAQALDPGATSVVAKNRDVHVFLLERVKTVLASTRSPPNPAFAPWHALAALPEAELATAGALAIARVASTVAVFAPIRAALAPPPRSRAELVTAYARALAATSRSEPHQDPELEQLRRILHGPGGPFDVGVPELDHLLDDPGRNRHKELRRALDELVATHPGAPPRANALEDLPQPVTPRVLLRGRPESPGPEVPRRFLAVLSPGERKPFQDGSGRLELARAIASAENPLTARVIVNRVWAHHFGRGLVTTPSDFGSRSDPPSHPELLDWLARRFVEDGWSLKKLHRRILLSSLWRQTSRRQDARAAEVDPENRLLWRQNRRRLDFEPLRDALLATSGQLDATVGGRSVPLFDPPFSRRRTLYGFVDRQNLPQLLRVFDFALPDTHAPRRFETTTPMQALWLMNAPFVLEQARALSGRAARLEAQDPARRVDLLHRLALGRGPTAEERDLALGFLRTSREDAAPPPPAVEWSYGYGRWDANEGKIERFRPLPHFTGSAWQGGPTLPDPKLGWCVLTADGGHPGNDLRHAVVRRFTAPRDGTVSIRGVLGHASDQGDGVLGRIALGGKELASRTARTGQERLDLDDVKVARGQTIDFVVECRAHESYDSFSWAPTVRYREGDDFDAARDFSGERRSARPPPLTRWERYAQVLLETNDFAFVD